MMLFIKTFCNTVKYPDYFHQVNTNNFTKKYSLEKEHNKKNKLYFRNEVL